MGEEVSEGEEVRREVRSHEVEEVTRGTGGHTRGGGHTSEKRSQVGDEVTQGREGYIRERRSLEGKGGHTGSHRR